MIARSARRVATPLLLRWVRARLWWALIAARGGRRWSLIASRLRMCLLLSPAAIL